MLYPVLGEKGVRGVGKVLDGFALISVAAGTVGPTGFIGLQLAFVLHDLWGLPDTISTQVIVIAVATVMFIVSACTGLKKGIVEKQQGIKLKNTVDFEHDAMETC